MQEQTEIPVAVQPEEPVVDQPQPADTTIVTGEKGVPPDITPEEHSGDAAQLKDIREGIQTQVASEAHIVPSPTTTPVPLETSPSTAHGLADMAAMMHEMYAPTEEQPRKGNVIMNFLRRFFNLLRRRKDGSAS